MVLYGTSIAITVIAFRSSYCASATASHTASPTSTACKIVSGLATPTPSSAICGSKGSSLTASGAGTLIGYVASSSYVASLAACSAQCLATLCCTNIYFIQGKNCNLHYGLNAFNNNVGNPLFDFYDASCFTCGALSCDEKVICVGGLRHGDDNGSENDDEEEDAEDDSSTQDSEDNSEDNNGSDSEDNEDEDAGDDDPVRDFDTTMENGHSLRVINHRKRKWPTIIKVDEPAQPEEERKRQMTAKIVGKGIDKDNSLNPMRTRKSIEVPKKKHKAMPRQEVLETLFPPQDPASIPEADWMSIPDILKIGRDIVRAPPKKKGEQYGKTAGCLRHCAAPYAYTYRGHLRGAF